MNLIRKGHGHTHRGVIGIESAIVLIAFVIVAAALAFVVLNMGFATSQKAKTSIADSIAQSGSSLSISGKVTGFADVTASELNATATPLKVTGLDAVDLDSQRVSVKYQSNDVEYDNILADGCTLGGSTEFFDAEAAFLAAVACDAPLARYTATPFSLGAPSAPAETSAIIYWSVSENANNVLDPGEHAVLGIAFSLADRPDPLDKMRAEIILPQGATLTVERSVPNLSSSVVDLG